MPALRDDDREVRRGGEGDLCVRDVSAAPAEAARVDVAGRRVVKEHEDAYGQAMLDHFHGRDAWEIVERDDGFFSPGAGPERYLAEFRDWRPAEKRAMRFARGRVLDVGCGAGRAMLHLQRRGLEVVGIDISPGALEVCRLRGLDDVHRLAVERLDSRLGRFDTVLLLGGGFGLLGDSPRARRTLRRLHRLTTPRGRVLAATRDHAASEDPDIQAYVARNEALGRLSGQYRLRIRYRHHVTPFFDFFRCSPAEMESIVEGTGWRVGRVLAGDADSPYVGILEKA